MYTNRSAVNEESCISFYPIYTVFISFPCLIPPTSISSSFLNRISESGKTFLCPNIRVNFIISPLHKILAVAYPV